MDGMIRMIGARGSVEDIPAFVKQARAGLERFGLKGQIVDSRYVLNRTHVELAHRQARRRFGTGRGISRSLDMEFLLFLAATHQISVAIDRLGVRADTADMLIIILEGPPDVETGSLLSELGLTPADPVFASEPARVLTALGIPLPEGGPSSSKEAYENAVYEQMSLVNLEK